MELPKVQESVIRINTDDFMNVFGLIIGADVEVERELLKMKINFIGIKMSLLKEKLESNPDQVLLDEYKSLSEVKLNTAMSFESLLNKIDKDKRVRGVTSRNVTISDRKDPQEEYLIYKWFRSIGLPSDSVFRVSALDEGCVCLYTRICSSNDNRYYEVNICIKAEYVLTINSPCTLKTISRNIGTEFGVFFWGNYQGTPSEFSYQYPSLEKD